MNKFSQQELEAAYEQMRQERMAECDLAINASDWLHEQLGFGNCRVEGGGWSQFTATSPYPTRFMLKLIHETYGPYQNDYEVALDSKPFATKKGSGYEVVTPYGTYDLIFEYFDNHCTGY